MPTKTIEMAFYKVTKREFRFLSVDSKAPVRQVYVAKEFFGVKRTASVCPVGSITVTVEVPKAEPEPKPESKEPPAASDHGPGEAKA